MTLRYFTSSYIRSMLNNFHSGHVSLKVASQSMEIYERDEEELSSSDVKVQNDGLRTRIRTTV